MNRLGKKFRRGLALFLASVMTVGAMPAIFSDEGKVKAAGDSTESTPSVTAFATKNELMTVFDLDGKNDTIGKIAFGKNSSMNTMEWYIAGRDDGVPGDNIAVFATWPITSIRYAEKFSTSTDNKTYYYEAGTGYGDEAGNTEVYANHYGASEIRRIQQELAVDPEYFTTAEQALMNATTVTTEDKKNGLNYTTTDILYAVDGVYGKTTLTAGSNNDISISRASCWKGGNSFWMRTPGFHMTDPDKYAQYAYPNSTVKSQKVTDKTNIQPASNFNLSNVIFASSANAANITGTIADGKSMTLRLDGKDVAELSDASVKYNHEKITYNAQAGTSLMVQGRGSVGGAEKDWYYSVTMLTGADNKILTAEEIKTGAGLDYTPNLNNCKIWLETTGDDGLTYAVMGEDSKGSVTAFAIPEELMTAFKPDSDGSATTIGKLVFGTNSSGNAQQWYILGKDTGVSGDNTIIFAASPIATGQKFNSSTSNKDYAYDAGTGYGESASSIEVNANHYGASDLRDTLQGMVDGSNTTYFTSAEQGLMNATTVTTNDTRNSTTYTTTDKLYALAADGYGSTTIKAGTNNQTVLAMSKYWSSGTWFWLRSPDDGRGNIALLANPGSYVYGSIVISGNAVQPASNLNLSSVLFASGAKAASSDTVSGTIASDTAMTLRLNGTNTVMGAVYYDPAKGMIVADKDADAVGTVSLVVQGNDGTDDWYYSKAITGKEKVTVADIKNKLSLAEEFNLWDCEIWLETTIDDMAYAKMAEQKNIESISTVTVTGVDAPVGGEAFDTEASCITTGIATTAPAITYTTAGESGDEEVTGNADWNTTYKATVTLATGIVDNVVYVFGDSVSVTINDVVLTDAITPDTDGTLTLTGEFTTAKRKIESVTAPTVPTGNTFTTYYGYDGYSDVLTSGGNSEFGTQATVTFEGTAAPTTADKNVTWTIANEGNTAYDKTPGATNTFRWTIPADALTNYNAEGCQGYDDATGNITDTVTITNKAATPVTITGTDSGIAYTGATIDVSQYFTIDSNAGTKTYTLITGTDGGTGEGELSGSTLTVTKTGTFKIKVETVANGIYAAGEKTITLTVANGTIQYTATDYSGTYDGQPHSISMDVTGPTGTTVTYSTDGTTYGPTNPQFTDEGTYRVYYRIEKENYDTINASKTVSISRKDISGAVITLGEALTYSNGAELTQTVDGVTVDGFVLEPDDDYTVEGAVVSKAGNYTLIITGQGNFTGNARKDFMVAKAKNAPNMPADTMLVPADISKVGSAELPEGWIWDNADKDKVLKIEVPVTATALYNKDDIDNYENITASVTITREKAEIPDPGIPFVKGDDGINGWNGIRDKVDKTGDGESVTIDMNGTSVVPGNVFDDIKGRDVTVIFDMGDGITWTVNGKDVTADKVGDIDFSVKTGVNTIPVDIINNVTGERYTLQISLGHEGEFGFTAVLSVNLDSKNAGLYANLFYYNEAGSRMEFICADEIAADGTAELAFTHASDYAVIIDREPMNREIAGADTGDRTPLRLMLLGVTGITAVLGICCKKKKRKTTV